MARTTTSPELQADADLHLDAVRAAHLSAVVPHGLLHGQGGVAGAHGVVLMGQRRPKQRHDAIAHDLVHRALIAVHGRHHALQDRVEELPGLLGITVGQQLHRALEVGKQHGDLLALAFQGAPGSAGSSRPDVGGVGEWWTVLYRGGGGGWESGAGLPVQTSTLPASSTARRWASMSSSLSACEGVVIQVELHLEGSIGHSAAAPQKVQYLIEHRIEVHERPSGRYGGMRGQL